MSDDNKKQNSEVKKQLPIGDFRETFSNKKITSNDTVTPGDIPPCTTGSGDSSGGESSADSESSENSQSLGQ